MKKYTVLIYMLIYTSTKAQFTPVEMMIGDKYLHYQHSFHRKFNTTSKFGWTHIATIMRQYLIKPEKGGRPNEIMNQVYLTTQLSNKFMLLGGLFFTPVTDMKISFAGQYLYRTKKLLLIVNPRFDMGEKFTYELFGLAEIRPAITNDLHLYSRFQFMTNHSTSGHNRSYQQLRLGLETKKVQLGLGTTLDQYGLALTCTSNTGIFIRKIL